MQWYPNPLGQECPEWPDYAKDRHPSGIPVIKGGIEHPGAVPYSVPTVRHMRDPRKEFSIEGHMRLLSASVRDAIKDYMPGPAFHYWLASFVNSQHLPFHHRATMDSINDILRQFNLRKPGVIAPGGVVRESLDGTPNMARFMLSLADRRKTVEHPHILVALALYQAAHIPYLGNLRRTIEVDALWDGHISADEMYNAMAVIEGPFQQFKGFIIYATLLHLILLKREDIQQASSHRLSSHELTLAAIPQAWQAFEKSKILRRDFSPGVRMICPANQHLRYAKDHRLLERLYEHVAEHQEEPRMSLFLDTARARAREAVYFREHYYYHYLGEAVMRERGTKRSR